MARNRIFRDPPFAMISSVGTGISSGLYDAPVQGMKQSLNDANVAAQKIAEGDVSPDNFVALMQANIQMKANRTVAVTADEMIGSLLNRKA